MTYTSMIKEKKFAWGGRALGTRFPAHGAVSIVGSVVGGARLATDATLADTHADMLLEGTKKYDKKQIQIILDSIGASLSFSVVGDRLTFTGRVREESVEKLLALVAEALRAPTFPEAELVALKARTQAELDMEAQDTRAQAKIKLGRVLFASEHPNWEESTEESRAALAQVTRKSLVGYHDRAIDISTLVVSIAGDIAPSRVFALTDKYFKSLPKPGLALLPFEPAAPKLAAQAVTTIKDKASIDYMLGCAIGITQDHAQYPALLIGTNILGNKRGFSGRLMKTVREEQGLTYGVYSLLSGFNAITDGMFVVWATFAPQLFAKGREAIEKEVKKIITKGVTALETKKHREMYVAAWKVQLSTSGAIARAAHDVVVDGKTISYLDQFPKQILKVTPAMVQKALNTYVRLPYLSESAAGPIDMF
jgi:zinc protease